MVTTPRAGKRALSLAALLPARLRLHIPPIRLWSDRLYHVPLYHIWRRPSIISDAPPYTPRGSLVEQSPNLISFR
jgi:hypothetical protein